MCTEVCLTGTDRCGAEGVWVRAGQVDQGLKKEEAAFQLDRVEKIQVEGESSRGHEKKVLLKILLCLVQITLSVNLQC